MEMFCLDLSHGDNTTHICLNSDNNYFVFFNVAKKKEIRKKISLFYQMSTPPPKPKEKYKTKQNKNPPLVVKAPRHTKDPR